jgi:hypothetical protein
MRYLRSDSRRRHFSLTGILVACSLLVMVGKKLAAVQVLPASQAPHFYQQAILPVLEKQCLMCHQGDSKKGGLDLTSREALLKGGGNGPAILPGNAKESLLYKLIAHEREPVMPYRMDKLPPETVALLPELPSRKPLPLSFHHRALRKRGCSYLPGRSSLC